MKLKLYQIAEMLGGVCYGDGDIAISSISGIEEAREGAITFLANRKYSKALAKTRASAVIVSQKQAITLAQVVVPDAYAAFGKLLGIFYPRQETACGISEKAFIDINADYLDIVVPGYDDRKIQLGGLRLRVGVGTHIRLFESPYSVE